MPSNGQFSAWIEIDGKKLEEYSVQPGVRLVPPPKQKKLGKPQPPLVELKTITCWIPSKLGKTFSVHLETHGLQKSDVWGAIEVDGSFRGSPGMVVESDSLPPSAECRGIRKGNTLRPFRFTALKITDDYSKTGDPLKSNFGSIIMRVASGKFVDEASEDEPPEDEPPEDEASEDEASEDEASDSEAPPCLPELAVHESSKKAADSPHQITLGEPELNEEELSDFRCTGPDLVEFCFKYAPLELLQANGDAPAPKRSKRKRAPTPEPSEKEDEKDRAIKEKQRALQKKRAELQKQYAELQKQLGGVEAELGTLEAGRNDKKNKKVPVKSEPCVIDPRLKKRAKLEGGSRQPVTSREVIDLSIEWGDGLGLFQFHHVSFLGSAKAVMFLM
ncbi:hypothetical protein FB45DRAFT_1051405, partial [Roridomyces roridus]